MKLRFKFIAVLVFLSLISVFLYQAYWLVNFYKEQSTKIEVDIMTALKDADYKEIYWRMSMLKPDSLAYQNNLGPSYISLHKKNIDQVTGDDGSFDVEFSYNADDMLRLFQQELHHNLNKIKGVDFAFYNNLLQIELTQKGIMLATFTEMIDLENDTVLQCIPDDISDVNRAEYASFVYPFDADGKYAYRLNVKQPKIYVLEQMAGILGTSLLMIICLFLSYIYLLRVILKQKSLDEIKSDFINNMTHELKTPISVAYAATDALQNFGFLDDPVKKDEYLNVTKNQLTHLTSLVEQILTMSVEERKNLKLSLENINLYNLFDHLRNQHLLHAHKDITIDIDVEPQNLEVKADKIHFQNVISNLIENSVKYSKESVKIKLSAKIVNGRALISIEDNGIGIPPASLNKVFDRFYRVPTGNIYNVKGYGLGLYYVKTIIEKQGGGIDVESKEGKGTIFNIKL